MENKPSYLASCTGCKEKLSRELIEWFPLVSVKTSLYYPGEPFCGLACYNRYVGQDDAPFREPDADQKRAFIRQMTVPL